MVGVRVVTVEVPNVVDPREAVAVLAPGNAVDNSDVWMLDDGGGRW